MNADDMRELRERHGLLFDAKVAPERSTSAASGDAGSNDRRGKKKNRFHFVGNETHIAGEAIVVFVR